MVPRAATLKHENVASQRPKAALIEPRRLRPISRDGAPFARRSPGKLRNLIARPPQYADRIAAPHHSSLLVDKDATKIDLDDGRRSNIGGRFHRPEQHPGGHPTARDKRRHCRGCQKSASSNPGFVGQAPPPRLDPGRQSSHGHDDFKPSQTAIPRRVLARRQISRNRSFPLSPRHIDPFPGGFTTQKCLPGHTPKATADGQPSKGSRHRALSLTSASMNSAGFKHRNSSSTASRWQRGDDGRKTSWPEKLYVTSLTSMLSKMHVAIAKEASEAWRC